MKHAILVPTDFSENAWTALTYAVHLAEKYDWNIQVLHVYQTFGYLLATADFNDTVNEHNTVNAFEQMEALKLRIEQEFPHGRISTACMDGNFSNTILDLAKTNEVQFIVMGTKGASGLKHVMIGSNTFELIQNSPIGVLAVPENYQDFRLQHIGLLSNFKPAELNLLESFIQRTSPVYDLSLLHVAEGNKFPKEEDVNFWKDQIMKALSLNSIHYQIKEMVNRLDVSKSIVTCVNELLDEQQIDLLLVSYTRKSFFRSMFGKNLPKILAHNLQVPTYFKKVNK